MLALVIVDESADGAQRASHGIELALELARAEGLRVRLFLLGATVELARADGTARPPYRAAGIERLVSGGVEVAVSQVEMTARGLRAEELILGAQPASSSTLAAWTLAADRILVF